MVVPLLIPMVLQLSIRLQQEQNYLQIFPPLQVPVELFTLLIPYSPVPGEKMLMRDLEMDLHSLCAVVQKWETPLTSPFLSASCFIKLKH